MELRFSLLTTESNEGVMAFVIPHYLERKKGEGGKEMREEAREKGREGERKEGREGRKGEKEGGRKKEKRPTKFLRGIQ
jgi:hypothetical protein